MTISSVAVTMRLEQSCPEIVTDMVVCVEWPLVADKRRSRLPDTRPLEAPSSLTKAHRASFVVQDAQYEWI
jgi:hypothetical protein